MSENFRRFETGPDPFGRTWEIEFRWIQNAISIRHSDTVDVKFNIRRGDIVEEKVVALRHPDLLQLSAKLNRQLTDPWCMKLAALHLKEMIETDRDMDKPIADPTLGDLERHATRLRHLEAVAR
ncbi:MAG TPA: hypothetical protein VES20_13715 [Bryobacteraceae bacterium]|nr:hypothetical protein [Bryobacteraceae bacterium]